MYSDELASEFHDEDDGVEISQWVSEVCDYSDSYGSQSSISYSAVNICGRPSKFPAYGDFAECFSMRAYGPSTEKEFSPKEAESVQTFHDFIVLKYETFVLPRTIKIYETYNPGTIFRILAYCQSVKKWEVLWQMNVIPVEKKSREFTPALRKINQPVQIIRIEFNHSLTDYYTGIDGVLLTGIKTKLKVERPISEQALIQGLIQKRLQNAEFQPQRSPSEAIEDFLKNDLNKFIETVGLTSYSKELENMNSSSVDQREEKLEKGIEDVPYEVLFNILSFLDLKSLFQCSKVSKTFRQIVLDPLIFQEVNLKFYWSQANSNLMNTLLPRCSLIKKLDLSSCGYFGSMRANDFIKFIQFNGWSLTNLRLNSTRFLNTACLEIISEKCTSLEELSIRNYMNVTADRDFRSLEKLSRLKIFDAGRSGIDTFSLIHVIRNNPNLQELRVAFANQSVAMDDICGQLSIYNPRLRSIDLWKCHNLTTVGIRALSELRELEEIDVGWCLREEASVTESLKTLLQNCRNLKKLCFAAIRGISERDLENIAVLCKNLEHLDLMGIVGVSTDNCKRILESCDQLQLLDVSFCENLDDMTIMVWRNTYNVCIKRSEVPNDG